MTSISSLKDPSMKVSSPELEIKRPTVVDVFLGKDKYVKTKLGDGSHNYTFRGDRYNLKDEKQRKKIGNIIRQNINKEAKYINKKYTTNSLVLRVLENKVYTKGDMLNIDLLKIKKSLIPIKSVMLGLEYNICVKVKDIDEGKIKVKIKAVDKGLFEAHQNLAVLFKDSETEEIELDANTDKLESDETLIVGKVTLRPKSDEDFRALQDEMIEHQTSDPEMSKIRDCFFYYTAKVSGHPKNKLLRYEGKKIGNEKFANAFNYEEKKWTVIDNYWQDPVKNPMLTNYSHDGAWMPIGSTFGETRVKYDKKKKKYILRGHSGLDLFGDIKTPLYASMRGIVKINIKLAAGTNDMHKQSSYGQQISVLIDDSIFIKDKIDSYKLDMEWSTESKEWNYKKHNLLKQELLSTKFKTTTSIYLRYAHILKSFVKENQIVYPGQKIGLLGCSGNGYSTKSPHLHFEISNHPTSGGLSGKLNPRYCVQIEYPSTKDGNEKQLEIRNTREQIETSTGKGYRKLRIEKSKKIGDKTKLLNATKDVKKKKLITAEIKELKKKKMTMKNKWLAQAKIYYEKHDMDPIIETGQSLEVENPQSLMETD